MEIERKFIVHNLPDNLDSYPHSEIEQGYLCMEPVIRIRRMNKQYFLTFKSKGLMARTEHEFPLDKAAYEHLLPSDNRCWLDSLLMVRLFLLMSIRLLCGIKLAYLTYLFQPFAHHFLNAGHCSLFVRINQL